MTEPQDVVVVGGGQAGLATGFYLRRTGLSYRILDDGSVPGGAWHRTWNSLRLFSPARFSSLPGWIMEGGPDYYPSRDEAIDVDREAGLAVQEEHDRRVQVPRAGAHHQPFKRCQPHGGINTASVNNGRSAATIAQMGD